LQQRVYWDSVNPVDARLKYYFEVFFNLKSSASLFYLQQRVYWDSVNPVDERLKYYFEVFLI